MKPANLAPLLCLTTILASAHGARAQGFKLSDEFTLKADLTFKETYDDNVYLLDTAAYPYLTPPPNSLIASPKKGSMVTTVTPSINLTYLARPGFSATLSYAPDMAWYESTPSQNYVAHRANLNFTGKIGEASYEWLNSSIWTEGSNISLTTMRPGDCRAIGGIPMRDRCDAALYRDNIKVTIPIGNWFFRPVLTSYVHDFQTEQQVNLAANKNNFVYDNYIDRWEVSGGMDVGYAVMDKTKLFVGYRYGHQSQGTVLKEGAALGSVITNTSPYDNNYQRLLAGIEGAPVPWLKLAVKTGPDMREWLDTTPAGFDRGKTLWYVDGQITVLATKEDNCTVKMTRFEQPAFTSQSVYGQDSVKYVLKDTLIFSGQLSAWGIYNQGNSLPVYSSGRYIPTLNYAIKLQNNRQFDFEGSANGFGVLGIHPFDETHSESSLLPYRAWARYSARHLELRAGLQKINFGSATLLRPLMWFDQLDPRDPLQLTNGVWGVLGRYYFLNNANLWLWSLYGNNKPRPWDMDLTNPDHPEFGGRFQSPVPKGEVGITFNHRVTDYRGSELSIPDYNEVSENRIGLAALVRDGLGHNPLDGSLYLFAGMGGRRLKVLYWDRNGFCLWQKRLEQDRFPWPREPGEARSISWAQLELLLDGIDFWRAHQERKYTNL